MTRAARRIRWVVIGGRAVRILAPNTHAAMLPAAIGNDHVIEFNEIHSVVYETNDAGGHLHGSELDHAGQHDPP